MGLIDWLKGSSSLPEADPPVERADVDWKAFEDALVGAITAQIAAFAQSHPHESYYGFALDCNAYYANVLFCLNTPEALEVSVARYAKTAEPEEIAWQRKGLEWSLGDWAYQGFNLDSVEWPTQVPMLDELAELPSSEDTEEFLVTCCRALIRAENIGAFSVLNTTPSFRVACIDHDEDIYDGDRRLDRMRASS